MAVAFRAQRIALRTATRNPLLSVRSLATQTQRNIPSGLKSNDEASQVSEIPVPQPPPREMSWLTRKIESDETWRYYFQKVATVLGYNSPKQIAGRRTLGFYQNVAAVAPDKSIEFWQKECDLPPTFQSWFTITTLHVWMLTVRFRGLPPSVGKHHVQFILDHFFIDVEDRIRAVLQPPSYGPPRQPYTFFSSFYVNPNAPATTPGGEYIKRSQAPERLVTRQLKIFKEQWLGMCMSFDLALVKDDMEMAGAIWRNILGARGARGIAYTPDAAPKFRRSVNLSGSQVQNPEKIDIEKEEATDDGSGVHDYPPEEADKYVQYPELMADIVTYVRRELVRLENLSDEQIMNGEWKALQFQSPEKASSTGQ